MNGFLIDFSVKIISSPVSNLPSEKYTYYVSSSANQVEFNFSTGSIGTASSTTLGYEITGSDEFGIVGKFKEL